MRTNYILPLILLNVLSALGSATMFWLSGWDLIWLGAFLATFPLPFLLIGLSQIFSLARTSARLPVIQVLSTGAVVLVAYALFTRPGPTPAVNYIALGIAIFGAVFVQWFVWSYSSYGRKKSASIVKGEALPGMPLQRLDGSEINSVAFVGTKTLIVFFRANWCPFCMNQLKEVLAKADRLKKAGVQVKFISNQGFDHSKTLAEQLELPAHYEILQDTDLRAAKSLGIEDIGGSPAGMPAYPDDTVMATVIALDAEGKVLFGDETDNYRVRPHPDTFIHVFE